MFVNQEYYSEILLVFQTWGCETENFSSVIRRRMESTMTDGEQVKVQTDEDMVDRGFYDSCQNRGGKCEEFRGGCCLFVWGILMRIKGEKCKRGLG